MIREGDMLRRLLTIVAAAAVLLTSAIGASPLSQAGPGVTRSASLDQKLSAAITPASCIRERSERRTWQASVR